MSDFKLTEKITENQLTSRQLLQNELQHVLLHFQVALHAVCVLLRLGDFLLELLGLGGKRLHHRVLLLRASGLRRLRTNGLLLLLRKLAQVLLVLLQLLGGLLVRLVVLLGKLFVLLDLLGLLLQLLINRLVLLELAHELFLGCLVLLDLLGQLLARLVVLLQQLVLLLARLGHLLCLGLGALVLLRHLLVGLVQLLRELLVLLGHLRVGLRLGKCLGQLCVGSVCVSLFGGLLGILFRGFRCGFLGGLCGLLRKLFGCLLWFSCHCWLLGLCRLLRARLHVYTVVVGL